MKITLTLLLLAFAYRSTCQTIYYDQSLHPTEKKNAAIEATGKMKDGLYEVTGHYIKSPSGLACIIRYTDASMQVKEGLCEIHSEDGTYTDTGRYVNNMAEGAWIGHVNRRFMTDSTVFHDDSVILRKQFFYYPNHRLCMVVTDDVEHSTFIDEDYDKKARVSYYHTMPQDYSGITLTRYKEATFPGGPSAWNKYVSHSLKSQTSEFDDKDDGTCYVRFIVDASGHISEVKSLNMQGSHLADLAFRMIMEGPTWEPAMKDGRSIKVIMIEPITWED